MSCKDEYVYKIIDRDTNRVEGSYERSYHTRYEFDSVEDARSSNVHGIYKDEKKYKIQKWKVTYELVDGDCDTIDGKTIYEVDILHYDIEARDLFLRRKT